MSYLEELLPEFRKGAKIRRKDWDKDFYIYMRDGFIYTKRGGLFKFEYEEFNTKDWEFYQKPIDWDYIIKNKCLCFFWDDCEDNVKIGILKDYNSYNEEYLMNTGNNKAGTVYNYCRPVRRDEVTFYENEY